MVLGVDSVHSCGVPLILYYLSSTPFSPATAVPNMRNQLAGVILSPRPSPPAGMRKALRKGEIRQADTRWLSTGKEARLCSLSYD
jgi:hypothetical protein